MKAPLIALVALPLLTPCIGAAAPKPLAPEQVAIVGGWSGQGPVEGVVLQPVVDVAGCLKFGTDKVLLDDAAADTGCHAVAGDVSSTDDVERAVATVAEEAGHVDILINNAGILRDKVLWKLTDDDWNSVLAVHAGGTFRFTRACVPHFRRRKYGRVVNITSYTGLHGNIGQANYATAKARSEERRVGKEC